MSHLQRILEAKRELLPGKIRQNPLKEMRQRAEDASPTRGFQSALAGSAHEPSLIAEVKRASPVKGLVREDFDAANIAAEYRDAGADCLSVLTDVEFFQGAPEYLELCRRISGRPCLRKDFTVDEYDVWEARALEADAVLLIMSALEPVQVKDYLALAEELGMDALVEAHGPDEARLAQELGAKLIGVNNRSLATFEVDVRETERAAAALEAPFHLVSESGLGSPEDIEAVRQAGARSVLIGTAFCRQPYVGEAVKQVMGW